METKSVLITGCSSGIGRKTAELLKSKGFDVFTTARRQEDVEKLKNDGFKACTLDVESSSSIKEALNCALSQTGNSLYALVNNAGFGLTSAVEDLTRDQLRRQFEVNVFGLQELTNLVIPIFRRQGYGRIVNISSVVGKIVIPYFGAYCASKFAVEALSDSMRLELCDTKIYVSLVEPGSINTKFSNNALKAFEELKDKQNSPHAKAYKIITERRKNALNKQSNKTPAEAVAKKILHALTSKKPRARYPVAPEAYIVAAGKRILPDSFIDYLSKIKTRKYK